MIQFIKNNKPYAQTSREDFAQKYLDEGCLEVPVLYNGSFLNPIWNGTDFIEGATPEEIAEANKAKVPQTARSMNFRLVLIQNGISMQSVYDLIDSLPTPQSELAYRMFEYATDYDRNNAMVNALAQMTGISQEQLDDFFIQAENLVI